MASVRRASAFALAGVLAFAAVIAGLATALAFAAVLALAGVLVAVGFLLSHFERNAGLRVGSGALRGDGRAAHQAGNRCAGNQCFRCHVDLSFSLLVLLNSTTAQYRRKSGKVSNWDGIQSSIRLVADIRCIIERHIPNYRDANDLGS
jgi:hypothetical protein